MKILSVLKYIRGLTIYQSVPAYNVNWILNPSFYDRILNGRTVTLVDIGARNVSAEELAPLYKNIRYIGFDADKNEVNRLNSCNNIFKESNFIPAYVGVSGESVNFFIHYEAGNSSIFHFNHYYNKWFRSGDENYVRESVKLESHSLDDVINEDVDVIKIDTQGSEYIILQGAKKCLSSALLVEVEVEFIQMYEGQKLAHDVMDFMYSNGFELIYLNRVFGKSKRFRGESRGQLIFGDALFGISRQRALNLCAEKKLKYVLLLLNYGHIDFAYDLYQNSQDLQNISSELNGFFESRNHRNKFITFTKFFIDKLIFLLLVFRKTNGLNNDSDRSWPIR